MLSKKNIYDKKDIIDVQKDEINGYVHRNLLTDIQKKRFRIDA